MCKNCELNLIPAYINSMQLCENFVYVCVFGEHGMSEDSRQQDR